MINTLKNGCIRSIIFKDKNIWYGVALELNIIESGDDPREVIFMLDEAIRGYLKTAKKISSEIVLNQKINPEYEKLWNIIQSKKIIRSPFKIYSSSFISLSSLI